LTNLLHATEAQHLYEAAREAMANSYAPYSKFAVGAAVLTFDEKIYKGVNVENASYGLTICAERIAIGNSITNGNRDIRAIAVCTRAAEATPCGACRQFIYEFGPGITIVYMSNGILVQKTIAELLPLGFDGSMLLHL
jgi:cytidine deaminase